MDARAAERFTEEEHAFLLSRVQPALIGLIDGSLSTLAPIFAVALSTEEPHIAFFAGLATAIGAAVSMGFSEALSTPGSTPGAGTPGSGGSSPDSARSSAASFTRCLSCSTATTPRSSRRSSTVTIELIVLAIIRAKFFRTGFLRSFATVTLGGAIIVAVSAALGSAA